MTGLLTMGYLGDTIADLRRARLQHGALVANSAWDEGNRTEWLIGAPASFAGQRQHMVAALRTRLGALASDLDSGAIDRALAAIGAVPRERFVCPMIEDLAYLPMPLEIGLEQTISHPEMVAVLAAAADPHGGDVLDVGTGSGYQAAVLARMAAMVTSMEIIDSHARLARSRLDRLGFANVAVLTGDAGLSGQFPDASFDAIVIAAGASVAPPALLAALKPGGRLVMPLGPAQGDEHLVRIVKTVSGDLRITTLCPARFVPLTGAAARTG